jgi:hypothetical protein
MCESSRLKPVFLAEHPSASHRKPIIFNCLRCTSTKNRSSLFVRPTSSLFGHLSRDGKAKLLVGFDYPVEL